MKSFFSSFVKRFVCKIGISSFNIIILINLFIVSCTLNIVPSKEDSKQSTKSDVSSSATPDKSTKGKSNLTKEIKWSVSKQKKTMKKMKIALEIKHPDGWRIKVEPNRYMVFPTGKELALIISPIDSINDGVEQLLNEQDGLKKFLTKFMFEEKNKPTIKESKIFTKSGKQDLIEIEPNFQDAKTRFALFSLLQLSEVNILISGNGLSSDKTAFKPILIEMIKELIVTEEINN